VSGKKEPEGYIINLKVLDKSGNQAADVTARPEKPVTGIVQIVNNLRSSKSKNNGPDSGTTTWNWKAPHFHISRKQVWTHNVGNAYLEP